MTIIGSLFSGYGGLDLAAAEAFGGARTLWHAETDPAAAKVLAARYPGAAQLGDVTKISWRPEHTIDVLTGGFPCQDISKAGGRKGMGEGTRSGLWSAMARAVAELRPPYVIVENVRAILKGADRAESCEACRTAAVCPARSRLLDNGSRRPIRRSWFGAVLGDLARLGYDAQWCRLRASDVGAPHHRDRVFVLARPAAENADGEPRRERRLAASGEAESGGARADARRRGRAPAADPGGPRLARHGLRRETRPSPIGDGPRAATGWAAYGPAIARWEHVLGRPAPPPVVAGTLRGQPKLNPAFVEWMMGLPPGWVTGVPGLTQNDQLRLLGNGVVPQQGATALRWLLDAAEAEAAS
jgi:DNA (cytosine-5)-methyltransferase 1